MTNAQRHSSFTYRMELIVIRLRDLVRSPTKVLMEAGVRPGMVVLDFGCGPGGFSLAAARLVGKEGRVGSASGKWVFD
jgi:predicted methyltransferase